MTRRDFCPTCGELQLSRLIDRATLGKTSWISVTERLPDVLTTVLCTLRHTIFMAYIDSRGHWREDWTFIVATPNRDGIDEGDIDLDDIAPAPTHWMPMPLLPPPVTAQEGEVK